MRVLSESVPLPSPNTVQTLIIKSPLIIPESRWCYRSPPKFSHLCPVPVCKLHHNPPHFELFCKENTSLSKVNYEISHAAINLYVNLSELVLAC